MFVFSNRQSSDKSNLKSISGKIERIGPMLGTFADSGVLIKLEGHSDVFIAIRDSNRATSRGPLIGLSKAGDAVEFSYGKNRIIKISSFKNVDLDSTFIVAVESEDKQEPEAIAKDDPIQLSDQSIPEPVSLETKVNETSANTNRKPEVIKFENAKKVYILLSALSTLSATLTLGVLGFISCALIHSICGYMLFNSEPLRKLNYAVDK